jgi:hypothetical protein
MNSITVQDVAVLSPRPLFKDLSVVTAGGDLSGPDREHGSSKSTLP